VDAAVAQMLEGMPEPSDLRRFEHEGQEIVTVGRRVLFCYPAADPGMRKMAVVTLTGLGFAVGRVAEVMGLRREYVSRLRTAAAAEGSAGLVRPRGRPATMTAGRLAQARDWHEQGISNVEIGRRLGVDDSTISRALRDRPGPAPAAAPVQEELPGGEPTARAAALAPPEPGAEPVPAVPGPGDAGAEPAEVGIPAGAGPGAGGPAREPVPRPGVVPPGLARAGSAVAASRYAGAMLLHACYDRIGAADVLAAALPAGLDRRRYDDLALLAVTSLAFALGACSAEGTKHLIASEAGPLAGIGRLPHLRTLRPRLAAIADGCDPLALQQRLAAAMLAADAPGLEVYYVDDHFVPYEGAKPVPKGWNTKRRHAQKGRADTVVTDYHGRAVCFASGEPSGLAATMAGALGQLREITGPGKKIMLGFDRGGAYPQVFRAVREHNADWITWRRGPLAVPAAAPRRYCAARSDGKPAEVLELADETVAIKDYGQARQITLFEDGAPVMQILTSDLDAPAAALLAWLRCRWRIENLFKYLEDHYGIHWLCDYHAGLEDDGHLIDNPARKAARARLAKAGSTLAAAERDFAALLASPALPAAAKNAKIPAAQKKIAAAQDTVAAAKAALDGIPAKLPANQVTPGAKKAILRTRRRALQMVLRLLAANAEDWLAHRLNAYLRDNDEYRAITRNLLHLGGTIAYTPATVTVTLDTPAAPRITRALRLLIDELNTTPPRIPGDPRPITYQFRST
jgi:Transposase protein